MVTWPNGKALDYESRDSRFDPWCDHTSNKVFSQNHVRYNHRRWVRCSYWSKGHIALSFFFCDFGVPEAAAQAVLKFGLV
jgi:hypothetical protein